MSFSQLPKEVTDEILAYAFEARGLKRGMRLRLVNKTFAHDVVEVVCWYCLLDETFRSGIWTLKNARPPFLARYIADRVFGRSAPRNDSFDMIRAVARRLTKDTEMASEAELFESRYRANVVMLCELTAQYGHLNRVFDERKWTIFNRRSRYCNYRDPVQYCLFTVATHLNNAVTEKIWTLYKDPYFRNVSPGRMAHPLDCLFGNGILHALRHGNVELLGRVSPQCPRQCLNRLEASSGSLACMKFLYDCAKYPWWDRAFDYGRRYNRNERVGWQFNWLKTPSVEVFEFMLDIRKHTKSDSLSSADLYPIYHHCISKGWVEMVEHLLNRGISIDARSKDGSTALQIACTEGHNDVIDFLLNRGADTAGALSCAAAHGHEDLVLRLFDRGLKMPTNMAGRAARLGRTTMLRMVLERGANPNWGNPNPFVSAVKYENKAMFDLLLEYGAVLTEDVRRACLKVCERERLESMMELLAKKGTETIASGTNDAGKACEKGCEKEKLEQRDSLVEKDTPMMTNRIVLPLR